LNNQVSLKVRINYSEGQGEVVDQQYGKALDRVYFTAIYNVRETLRSVLFGGAANSIALIGFALESIVGSLSGLVRVWRLRQHDRAGPEEEAIESRALRLVAISFVILGFYVLLESIRRLAYGEPPESAPAGMIIAAVSLLLMPLLAGTKHRAAREANSKALMAEFRETLACSFPSLALLLGLGSQPFRRLMAGRSHRRIDRIGLPIERGMGGLE